MRAAELLKSSILIGLALLLLLGQATVRESFSAEAEGWARQAARLEAEGNWTELLKHSFRWTRTVSGDHLAWFNMGLAQEQLGLEEKAEASYNQALRCKDDFAPAWYNLGVLLRKRGAMREAIAANLKALEIVPDLAPALFNLGVLYQQSGRTGQAIESYRQLTKLDPKFTSAWFNLGVSLGNSGRLEEAVIAFNRAAELEPENSMIQAALARARTALKNES